MLHMLILILLTDAIHTALAFSDYIDQNSLGPIVPHHNDWHVEVAQEWDVLGPFPIHAREQHFLSPSFPVNLSQPIDYEAEWSSAYADGGKVKWTKAHSVNGALNISFPDIRWSELRSTEGWAALQHHTLLRTTITVLPPAGGIWQDDHPRLLINIQRGSFFTLRPRTLHDYPFAAAWHAGDIYEIGSDIPHAVPLPTTPSRTSMTHYDLFVSGDYEIRLFGDPQVSDTETPHMSIHTLVSIQGPPAASVLVVRSRHVIPDFVDGWAFGSALGVGLRASADWLNIVDISLRNAESNDIAFTLMTSVLLAPFQTRVIPLVITQNSPFLHDSIELEIHVDASASQVIIPISLDVSHLPAWTQNENSTLLSTYFSTTYTPTPFVALPPKRFDGGDSKPPILSLHGAGVNIVVKPIYDCEPPRQRRSWVIIPTGRTSWGMDWHGISAVDAWASVTALATLLNKNPQWCPFGFSPNTRLILMGHSNGGQGAWHIAAREPDRVLAVIPAAAYSKSQSYVPLIQSRSAHFIDPMMRAILESSMTPDDNDLFLTNLLDVPVLAVHGGADENVPVWHSRILVDILKTLGARHVMFREDPGKPHCYAEAFGNPEVQSFIDSTMDNSYASPLSLSGGCRKFTLTVAIPSESGPLHGFRIVKLEVPGRLARLTVAREETLITVITHNVAAFSVEATEITVQGNKLLLDGHFIHPAQNDEGGLFFVKQRGRWTVSHQPAEMQLSGRSSTILLSPEPIVVVIPHEKDISAQHAALRIAHDLEMYHRLDVEIIDAQEAMTRLEVNSNRDSNIITIGGRDNLYTAHLLRRGLTPFGLAAGGLTLHDQLLSTDLGAIFLHPHLSHRSRLTLVLYYNNEHSMERVLRLLPLRTGITVPDWLLIGPEADFAAAGGVRGAGVWGSDWTWSEGMSSF